MNFGAGKIPLARKVREKISNNFEEQIDVCFIEGNITKVGYLANVKSTTHIDNATNNEFAAIFLYFIEPNGRWFKAKYLFKPYFYILCDESVINVDAVQKEDLTLINHLSGKTQKYVKLEFRNEQDLMSVRKELTPLVKKNQAEQKVQEAYDGWYNQAELADTSRQNVNFLSKITGIREYDLVYQIRVQIDNEIRVGRWYDVSLEGPLMKSLELKTDMDDKAEIRVLAFDIETTKQPLKFPDVRFDQIMMISYIIDGSGFLITNREFVSEDIKNFEYAPREDYDVGEFKVFNEPDEINLLKTFFDQIRQKKPTVFSTYNGDNFDWPFIQARADHHKLKMEEEIGIFNNEQGEFTGRFASHMDCLYWVKRDAFLPQGSHGLKMVTKAKLGYDPVELDPEDMMDFAKERPQHLAEYSVSDAVATYFLYMQQIHDFIFALCTIIPTNPDDVLRRGSGTLCENLLMAQAFRNNIIFPNKQTEDNEKFYKNKLIDTETYVGGHVECLRQGVFRSDFPVQFRLQKQGYENLIQKVSKIMDFALQIEPGKKDKSKVTNFDEIKQEIETKLIALRDQCPIITTTPLIYHVDVGAMYPNIILTNRLQPTAIVNEQICAGCVFNKESNDCKRKLDWVWRSEVFTLNKGEYEKVKLQLNEEQGDHGIRGHQETQDYQKKLKQRVKQYCSGTYKKVHSTATEVKHDTVCMRENSFYVDTVRDFRDRRNEFKILKSQWARKLGDYIKEGDLQKQEKGKHMVALYESLQLAHKIILNSFYGYVMRRGARWYSMEMAAMVTHTGGNIIKDSTALYEQIGMPLELDTDGIWTLLPKGFPETFTFKFENGDKFKFDFPCTMSNEVIYEKYGNPQYQTLTDKKSLIYDSRLEMSIFFEIDGPYKCMLIPASTEENKMLKKRYAVFNHAGKMTEVKGFELKRRGELQIVKIFQQEVFTKFLEGNTLQECYDACGEVAQRWYDILTSKGEYVNDQELVEYIGESRILQKTVEDYGAQKGLMITCAKRLSEFLGAELKTDKGLNVKFIISKFPQTASITERAIPTVIFGANDFEKKKFLIKWTKNDRLKDFNLREILDWDYYKDRLAGTIMKIVTIPAALQNCMNPVPQIEYPDWLHKKIAVQNDKFKQKKLGHFFKTQDIEDIAKKQMKFSPVNMIKTEFTPVAKPKVLNMENCPSPNVDFGSWLCHQKANWRNIRTQLKQNNQIVARKQFNPIVGKQSMALTNFMRNMDDTVLNSIWHIVQIEQTFEPGILKLWALTSQGNMFNIRLQVGRTVYINSKVVSTEPDFKKVQKDLPRGRRLYHLYEWETTEDDFQNKFNNIKYTHLLSNNIEGIYETKVPPKFRALMILGNVVKPHKQMLPRNEQALGRTYKLPELEIISGTKLQGEYLPADSFQKIFLLHSYTSNRHLCGLFIEATHEVCFYVVNPALKATINAQGQLNLESVFSKTLAELSMEVEFASWQVVDQKSVTELSQALKQIEARLQEYRQKNKASTIVILQSDHTQDRLQYLGLHSLSNDFPVLKCPVVVGDNEFPALDWLRYAMKNMTARFTEVGVWLNERIEFSRYAVIPLCNLESDSQTFVIDTLYARSLYTNKHLIWYSEGAQPDLGGHEDRNYRMYFQDQIENPELTNKGFYRKYSIEINISHLALNTILCYDQMTEYANLQNFAAPDSKQKNSMLNQAGQDFDADLDEFVTCGAAFQKLKGLVFMWMQDKERYNSEHAGDLLMHLYRWLTSQSKLYDPLLHRMIHKLMSKNFYMLLSTFKKLGCQIIYGNFQKLILQTNKRDFEDARAHIEFVLNQIREDSMFKYLGLETGEYWQILLFKDIYNYAGITESNPDRLFAELNIVRHLPEAIRHKFKYTVMELCTKALKFNRRNNQNEVQEEPKSVVDYMEVVEDFTKEPDHDYICKLISEYFSQKLLQTLEEILNYRKKAIELPESDSDSDEQDDDSQNKKYAEEKRQKELARWEFPQCIGSYNDYSVPALEFTKMVCYHIFGLDASFSQPASTLMKNMLTLLKVKEFSQEVVSGKEPSLTLVVPDVICSNCQSIMDLDICRNTELYEDTNTEQPRSIWPCKYCDSALNKQQVERRLLEILNRRVVNYQMQDLKCKSCQMITNQIVKRFCQCTGRFTQTVGTELPEKLRNQNLLNQMTDIKLIVRLMRNFGQRHNMQMLRCAADNYLLIM